MPTAKEIRVRPIPGRIAAALIRRVHYSHKVVRNSQLHLGVFLGDRLEGAMQFGPAQDKRKVQGLVAGTAWNGFLELNRLAFTDALPRNSESRALAVAMRLIRAHYPQVEWILSFADATQCGDGAIYRAAGFVLTGIKRNTQTWIGPMGDVISRLTVTQGARAAAAGGVAGMSPWRKRGYRPMPGFQLRYVYFLTPGARARLTVPTVPFDRIAEVGATMYRGTRPIPQCAESIGSDAPGDQSGEGGAHPTSALHGAAI